MKIESVRTFPKRSIKRNEYVLITPARNEEVYIGSTIESVACQTLLPQKWVIVSDGSVDSTDEIVTSYACRYRFIQLLRTGEAGDPRRRDFGGKVRAFQAGYGLLGNTPYQFVGNLDADITLPPTYFETLLRRFHTNAELGVGGGIVLEPDKERFLPQRTSPNSVCGSVQLFRRECYEAFGGYVPLQLGGVDAAAEIMARMHGWQVQVFSDLPVRAQRRVITGGTTVLQTRFRQGISNYLLGYHPLFQLASCASRINRKPYVIGSIAVLLGYAHACLSGYKRVLPDNVCHFLRSEQIRRLFSYHPLRPLLEQEPSGGRPS